jgi:hypothetical protein
MPPTARSEAGQQRAQWARGRLGQLQSSHVATLVGTIRSSTVTQGLAVGGRVIMSCAPDRTL